MVITQDGEELASVTAPLDENGQIVVEYTPESTSDVEISVVFDQTPVYVNSTGEETVSPVESMNVIMDVTAEDTIIDGVSIVTVTVVDEDGNPIMGTVDLTFVNENGTEETVTVYTNEAGVAVHPYTNTSAGKNVTVTAELVEPTNGYDVEPVSDTFEVAKLDTTITIVPEANVTAHKPTNATITVSTEEGRIPAGEDVTVVVTQNGVELANITSTLDDAGQIVVNYTAENTDDIIISVVFNETPVFNSADADKTIGNIKSINTILNITSQDVPINGTSIITLNVTDELGNPATGTAILTVDGQLVEVPVENGIGELPYTNTRVGKNVTVTGYFADNVTNGYIRSPVNSTTFEVAKFGLDIAIDLADPLTAHETATATITVIIPPIGDEPVFVLVDNEEVNIIVT
ncbi:MAG: hypothetical protein BZ136_09185, partial [Methanosphaera sp. rholeuAM74]